MRDPTRTCVAPSSMATTKSWLIPIESVSNTSGLKRARSFSKYARMVRKYGRAASAVTAGGTHINPRKRKCGTLEQYSAKESKSSSGTPPFWSSAPMLTWIRMSCTTSFAAALCPSRSARFCRSTDSIRSAKPQTYFILFVCSCPTKCTLQPCCSKKVFFSFNSWA